MRKKIIITKVFRPVFNDPSGKMRTRVDASVQKSNLSRPAWLARFAELGLKAMEGIDWEQKLR